MKIKLFLCLLLLLCSVIFPFAQTSASLLVAIGDHPNFPGPTPEGIAYGYGENYWDNMTAALNTASGGHIATTQYFDNLSLMLSYDAIWLDCRNLGFLLSDVELQNITTFIATGRRVVLMGDNYSWQNWNNQILGLVGSSYAGGGDDGTNPLVSVSGVSHELTAGVTTLRVPAYGIPAGGTGGTALFQQNFATLWGDNVLTVLDVNFMDDSFWSLLNNAVFAQNIATWINASPNPVPLPGSLLLLATGLLGMGLIGLRHRG